MIGIVDYGMGNLLSVYNAFDYLGEDVMICSEPEQLKTVDRIIIPGVGAFKDCMEKLSEKHFIPALNEQVLKIGKPTLGICLGMQIMANQSEEGGMCQGLGWFDASVIKIPSNSKDIKIPNIGWNEIQLRNESQLFKKIPNGSDFYFVHSYYMDCKNRTNVIASYEYGSQITAAVQHNNIMATQFHPEKSQDLGLSLLINFIDWEP